MGGIILKLFHLVLRGEEENDWMRIDVLDEKGEPLPDSERLAACCELGKITIGETMERDGFVCRLPAGDAHAGYFREHLAGISCRKLREIRMTKDMVPRLVFSDGTGLYNDKMILSFVPDRIEMIMVRNNRTEIIIRI